MTAMNQETGYVGQCDTGGGGGGGGGVGGRYNTGQYARQGINLLHQQVSGFPKLVFVLCIWYFGYCIWYLGEVHWPVARAQPHRALDEGQFRPIFFLQN